MFVTCINTNSVNFLKFEEFLFDTQSPNKETQLDSHHNVCYTINKSLYVTQENTELRCLLLIKIHRD